MCCVDFSNANEHRFKCLAISALWQAYHDDFILIALALYHDSTPKKGFSDLRILFFIQPGSCTSKRRSEKAGQMPRKEH
jgi:hypothetical protein